MLLKNSYSTHSQANCSNIKTLALDFSKPSIKNKLLPSNERHCCCVGADNVETADELNVVNNIDFKKYFTILVLLQQFIGPSEGK